MSAEVHVVKRLNDGLALLRYRGTFQASDDALWATAKTRKSQACCVCDRSIVKGAYAWRPLGNQMYRMKRICLGCLPQK